MRILGLIVSWMVGLCAILIGLSMLPIAPYAAIPMAALAAFVLPPIRAWAAQWIPNGLSFSHRVLACVLLVIGFFVVLVTTVKGPEISPSRQVSPQPAPNVTNTAPAQASVVSQPTHYSAAPAARPSGTVEAMPTVTPLPTPPAPAPVVATGPKAPIRPSAAGEVLKLEIFLVPPKGVYVRPNGLKYSGKTNDPRSTEVNDAIEKFAKAVAPGHDDVEVANKKPDLVSATTPSMDFELHAYFDTNPGTILCTVGLTNPAPKATEIDTINAAVIELAKCIHPGRDVSTITCLGDDVISESYYTGELYYEAATDTVGLNADRKGGNRVTTQKEHYILVNQKSPYLVKNLAGKFFYTVQLVYPKKPASDVAMKDMLAELVAVAGVVEGDVNASVYVGTPDKNPPWHQLKDEDDSFKRYIFAEYSAASGVITAGGRKFNLSDFKK